ncbi:MAG: multifunctional oxoglutarate decarboxylase/oxoglutarate dehydrogenase thiamine pyrophosphate-binding subunit/dihydrolipoyllysine-residue succinyltransferase subunit [Rhizobacter sp.]|nr:multifunctional oxoglutarate decarboxylase/oxoglutarate dehydrogenase thiamine pyrophosphate-binding subunit/dihydrolipoyllysine-residue succinyltransferase subunit [Chlorobiales bacterium]
MSTAQGFSASKLSIEIQEKLVDLFGPNSAFIQDLMEQYEDDPASVKESWHPFFEDIKQGKVTSLEAAGKLPTASSDTTTNGSNGTSKPTSGNGTNGAHTNGSSTSVANGAATQPANFRGASIPAYPSLEAVKLGAGETASAIIGVAAKIVENMEQSLAVPTATSQRTIPVKVLEENRKIILQHLALMGKSKISFTHIIAWAIVQAVKKFPSLNAAYASVAGKPHRIAKAQVNIGLAVDMTRKDGSRSLIVPNIKGASAMTFDTFIIAYDALVAKARTGQVDPADFQGTTISLTNPGTVGTVSSTPRLMTGQGAIIATGAIDYTAEYHAMSPEMLSQLGVSKVMTVTSTYDHRIIQGAESGQFLAHLHKLLLGEENFYDGIFIDLKMPYKPWKKAADHNPPSLFTGGGAGDEQVLKQAKVIQLINAYRVRGHLIANINPLGYDPNYHPELDPEYYGFTIWDLDREFLAGELVAHGSAKSHLTLREIIGLLRDAYCEKTGTEYMFIQDVEQKQWIRERVEPKENRIVLTAATKKKILRKLIAAEGFERYLHTKFLGHKRFSIEGGETAIAMTEAIIEYSATYETKEVVIAMAHRGRINVLTNIVGKPYYKLFAEFEGKVLPKDGNIITQGSGDVKYHLGAVGTHTTQDGKEVKVSVAANPSHLEWVNPVVEGIVRAKQDRMRDLTGDLVLPLHIHGDAAFAGQGVVAETLNLSQLEGYRTGGTVHLIINNQIGFTTNPQDARSTQYASDVAKMVQAPVFHVNGDDPEACVKAALLALDFRMKFDKDVVIDMICYRKYGHNEGDEPAYTQPLMYRKIKEHPGVLQMYADQLIQSKVITEGELEVLKNEFKNTLDAAYEKSKASKESDKVDLTLAVAPSDIPEQMAGPETKVSMAALQAVVKPMMNVPEKFNFNKKLAPQFQKRAEMLTENASNTSIDWAFAEALAFGTLLQEGTPIRLSGQDSTRGTFSQRHLGFYDTESGAEYIPLQHIENAKATFNVYDSLLSEAAAMGFEFGYSVADPLTLVLWEAQFGDFVNGAQIIIDQFIASSESKWGQPVGLVLLLPHGYEGQGPEHSSARLERFLQLCAENNLQVCNCTTPAQYFHLLRRQVKSGNQKPLVVMTPKSLLRHPLAVSHPQDLTNDKFHRVLGEIDEVENVRRVVMCSGKVYYDLLKGRREKGVKDVAILRLEQLYPYPKKRIIEHLSKYGGAGEICWTQEEPKNMGGWSFIAPLLVEELQSGQKLRYIGRAASASPATGSAKTHEREQQAIVSEALA